MEILAITLVIFFMVPLVLVFINANKTNEILNAPLSLHRELGGRFGRTSRTFGPTRIFVTVRHCEFGNRHVLFARRHYYIIRYGGMGSSTYQNEEFPLAIFMMFVAAMVIPFKSSCFHWSSGSQPSSNGSASRCFAVISDHHRLHGFGSSLSIFMFHGFMKSIPLDIEEAAYIDGCGKVKTFFLIVLPILKPIYVTVLILNGIWIWNDFLLPHACLR
jgi:raffinose/stachyose/melibiose transport system permease protein